MNWDVDVNKIFQFLNQEKSSKLFSHSCEHPLQLSEEYLGYIHITGTPIALG